MKKKLWKTITASLLCVLMLTGCGNEAGQNGQTTANNSGEVSSGAAQENSTQGEASQKGNSQEGIAQEGASQEEASLETQLLTGKHHVNIHIKDKGIIAVELDADNAPITVTNFIQLAESGFYDGLTFHRIIKDFMMQGGDPQGDGTGGSETEIKGEFSANGVDNPLSHTRGAISMARSQRMDSASSQFFIVHQDNTGLDGSYAVFGYVTEGIEIVDDICENTTGQDYNGVVPVENRPIIEKIEVVD